LPLGPNDMTCINMVDSGLILHHLECYETLQMAG